MHFIKYSDSLQSYDILMYIGQSEKETDTSAMAPLVSEQESQQSG